MGKFAIVLTVILGFVTQMWAQPAIGTTAFNFNLDRSTPGPDSLRLSTMLGEVVLLNFFGATCSDCIEDAPLSEEIYQTFSANPDFNMVGIDVWNLPAAYVQSTFRAQTGITYTLLVNGRTTGYAYNMETNPVPSAIDNEHRGYVIVDREGIMRHYWIYNPFDESQQQEIIAALNAMFDPCNNIEALEAPQSAILITLDAGGPLKLCWEPVSCASHYLVYRSEWGDWTDETLIGTTTDYVYPLEELIFEHASYRVVAERIAP